MSSGRRRVVYGLIAIVLGGNLVSFIFNRQVWPYSPYPMFAEARELTFDTLHWSANRSMAGRSGSRAKDT